MLEWRGGRVVILSFVGFGVGIGGFACEKPRYIKAEPDGIVGRVCDSVTGGYERRRAVFGVHRDFTR